MDESGVLGVELPLSHSENSGIARAFFAFFTMAVLDNGRGQHAHSCDCCRFVFSKSKEMDCSVGYIGSLPVFDCWHSAGRSSDVCFLENVE